MRRILRTLGPCACACAALGLSSGAAAESGDGGWQFNLMPYLWFPAVTGSIDTTVEGLPGSLGGTPRQLEASGTVNPDNYLSNLDMAFMLTGEARKGNWAILTDIIYADLGNQDTRIRNVTGPLGATPRVARDTKTDMNSIIWTFAGGYRVADEAPWSLDLIGGFRYLELNNDLTVDFTDERGQLLGSTKASMDQSNWDGIIGIRSEYSVRNTPWFVPFYADIGTGSSDLSWQAILGLGYRFDWGEATLAWRAIGYEFDGNDVDLTLSGPALGVGFRW